TIAQLRKNTRRWKASGIGHVLQIRPAAMNPLYTPALRTIGAAVISFSRRGSNPSFTKLKTNGRFQGNSSMTIKRTCAKAVIHAKTVAVLSIEAFPRFVSRSKYSVAKAGAMDL